MVMKRGAYGCAKNCLSRSDVVVEIVEVKGTQAYFRRNRIILDDRCAFTVEYGSIVAVQVLSAMACAQAEWQGEPRTTEHSTFSFKQVLQQYVWDEFLQVPKIPLTFRAVRGHEGWTRAADSPSGRLGGGPSGGVSGRTN